jgi:hypothetical protein
MAQAMGSQSRKEEMQVRVEYETTVPPGRTLDVRTIGNELNVNKETLRQVPTES